MPKNRKASTSDSDSGPDDRAPAKKSKAAPPPKKSSAKHDEEDTKWEIGRNRFVSLSEFKGKWYVNLREYYMDANSDMKPGKKGIMLTMEQFQKFKDALPDREEAIKTHV